MKIIFVDTETTGFSDTNNDIIQLAGLVTENREVIDTFNFRCKPVNWKSVSTQALAVTGLTMADLRTFPEPRDAFTQLKNILDKHVVKGEQRYIIAGQNVAFDWKFLTAFWNKHKTEDECDFDYYFNKKTEYELMELTKPLKKHNHISVPNVKLGTIMESLNIVVDGKLHDALTDIKGTYEAFYKILDKWIEIHATDNTFVNKHGSNAVKHIFRKMKL